MANRVNRYATERGEHGDEVVAMEFQKFDPGDMLSPLLNEARKEQETSGELLQKVGWVLQRKAFLSPTGMPYEKYRFGRAVSEVAERLGAEAILAVADGYVLDEAGNRSGLEVVQVLYVNPDGSSAMKHAKYTRRKHPQVRRDIITFLLGQPVEQLGKLEQGMFPAWGEYRPN